MKTLTLMSLSICTALTLAFAGCIGGDPEPSVSTSEALAASPAMLVGTYRFVYTDSRRAAVEAALREAATTPEALQKAVASAEAEANASEIEFAKDGLFHSRIEGKEILAAPYSATAASGSTLVLTMTSPKGEEKKTTVRFQDADTIVIQDPKKGELTFRRANIRG